jgi:MFS family permease
MLMVGLTVFTAASLACALATTDSFLIAMRGVQGLGAAIVLPAALSIVMNMFEEGAERNKALGAWGGIGAAGATVGLIAGGLLTRYIGWEYIFFLNVPIGAVALLLAGRIVPESRLETERRRYDPFGAVTITGGLLLLVYALSEAPHDGWGSARTIALLAAAAGLVVAFAVIETRTEAPLLPLRILRLRTLVGANAVGLLLGGSFFAFIFVGTLYMQQVLGYSAIETGVAWLTASLTSVAFAGLSQALVTRVSAKLVMAAGMGLIAGGIFWATAAPADGRFWNDLPARSSSPEPAPRSPSSPSRSPRSPAWRSRTPASPPGCSIRRSRSAVRSALPWHRRSLRHTPRRSPMRERRLRLLSPAGSSGRSGSAVRSRSPASRSRCCSYADASSRLQSTPPRRRPCERASPEYNRGEAVPPPTWERCWSARSPQRRALLPTSWPRPSRPVPARDCSIAPH